MSGHNIERPGLTEHTHTGSQSTSHRRKFAAPAALVQRAHAEAELFTQWMGPRGTTVRIEQLDAYTGGAFRYVVEAPSGDTWSFYGSYHVVSPGLIVHTWQYEDESEITLETLRFIDIDGGSSSLDVTSTYTSQEACDALLASEMDDGMNENFERLDALLMDLQPLRGGPRAND